MTWVDTGGHEQPVEIGAVIFHVGPAGTSVTYDLPGHNTAEAHAEALRIVRAAVVGDLRAAGKDGAVHDRLAVPTAVAAVLRRDGSLYWQGRDTAALDRAVSMQPADLRVAQQHMLAAIDIALSAQT